MQSTLPLEIQAEVAGPFDGLSDNQATARKALDDLISRALAYRTGPGVEPVFPEKRQAINYAENRAWFRSGEIRILDSTGKVERTIPFSEADRKL